MENSIITSDKKSKKLFLDICFSRLFIEIEPKLGLYYGEMFGSKRTKKGRKGQIHPEKGAQFEKN